MEIVIAAIDKPEKMHITLMTGFEGMKAWLTSGRVHPRKSLGAFTSYEIANADWCANVRTEGLESLSRVLDSKESYDSALLELVVLTDAGDLPGEPVASVSLECSSKGSELSWTAILQDFPKELELTRRAIESVIATHSS